MIIFRYLIKEVLAALIAVTLVLLLIFLSNQLVRYLSYAAAGKIAASFVVEMLGFEIPYLLALLLPLGFYLGIILAYGRMYAENELPVLQACGFSLVRLLAITSALAGVISAVVLILMLWVNPYIADQKGKGLAKDTVLSTLRAGRFQVLNDGHSVIYVETISRDRTRAKNLFIAQQSPKAVEDNSPWTVISATNAYQEIEPTTHQKFIVANTGYRYDGTPGLNDYKIIQFKKYALRLPAMPMHAAHQEQEAIPSATLWQHYQNPVSAAELQWRLAMPLSVFVLMILAIPFSRVRPRQGRYTYLIPAVLLYIIYVNVLFMARNWVEQASVPIFIGMWWVHLVLLGLGILLLFLQQNYKVRSFVLKNIAGKKS
ncbi:MAG: LPS export ABC transporter permease LptF [Gammaproteobacteria bacterium]|nr:LPS export ABC transporter permease LptF [Gammaproteobacteria bacterium]